MRWRTASMCALTGMAPSRLGLSDRDGHDRDDAAVAIAARVAGRTSAARRHGARHGRQRAPRLRGGLPRELRLASSRAPLWLPVADAPPDAPRAAAPRHGWCRNL